MEPTANTVPVLATNAKVHARATCIRPRPFRRPDHQLACYPLSSHHGYEGVQGGLETVNAAALILADEEGSPAPMEGFQYALSHMGLTQEQFKLLNGVGHSHCIESEEQVTEEIAIIRNSL